MPLSEEIARSFSNAVLSTHRDHGEETIILRPDKIVEVCRTLKESPAFAFNYLMDLTAVDYLHREEKPRFAVVYHLYSLSKNERLRIKVPVEESICEVPSVTSIWPVANWLEREVWDMFGIRFAGHPHLKRLLMYEKFQGHPLRKDYPFNKRQPLIGPVN